MKKLQTSQMENLQAGGDGDCLIGALGLMAATIELGPGALLFGMGGFIACKALNSH